MRFRPSGLTHIRCRPKTRLQPFSTVPGSTGQDSIDSKAFSKTLLLPKTTFPLRADPGTETALRSRTCEELYRWQWANGSEPTFVLHDGPPYANGDLHIGHALNKILKDIINRFHVLRGRRVHYIPGWDCHGLPIENKALQELGKPPLSLPANTIRAAARSTAIREINSQREQFRQLGIMADWSQESTYRTLDHSYEIRQLRIFQKMVERGLIYRHYRPVYYSPSSRSALAEAELIYKDDHLSHSAYVTFPIDLDAKDMSPSLRQVLSNEPHAHLLVWTTTPWTLSANMGIAVHPALFYSVVRQVGGDNNWIMIVARDRIQTLTSVIGQVEEISTLSGSELVGTSYLPLFSSASSDTSRWKVIPASHVTAESGTGLVHCAPAHGAEDYHAFRSLGLTSSTTDMLCHVDGSGRFNGDIAEVVGNVAKAALVGKEVLGEGSKAVLEVLKDLGRLVKVEKIRHRYPYDWKTNEPVLVTATSQWFANLDGIKEDALTALGGVSFVPPATRNRLEAFIRSRSEWCISRQRVWGVPIPALYNTVTGSAVLNSSTLEHIISVLEKRGVAHWWDGPVEDFVPPSLCEPGDLVHKKWRKDTDTMDVWFDSGTSWSMLGAMHGTDGCSLGPERRDVADVCIEGSDQHRGWFQSQLLTAVGSAGEAEKAKSPYRTLITHGMVLDEDGKKMSKSLGNIVNPMIIVKGGKNKTTEPGYGADVLRLWAATVEYWRDMSIGPTVLAQAAECMRKIRNSARFILGNIGDGRSFGDVPRDNMSLADRYVMHELYKLERVALEGYASYNFPKVINALSHFTNITLSSLYFDITKDILYADTQHSQRRQAVVATLKRILATMTFVLAPVLPHLAEEIHGTNSRSVQTSDQCPSFFQTKWTELGPEWNDPQAEKDMNELFRVRTVVLSLLERARGQKQLRSSLEAEVDLILPDEASSNPLIHLLRREEDFLKTFCIVSNVHLIGQNFIGTPEPLWMYSNIVSIPACDTPVVIRIHPPTLGKCPRCWTYTQREEDQLCNRCRRVLNQ